MSKQSIRDAILHGWKRNGPCVIVHTLYRGYEVKGVSDTEGWSGIVEGIYTDGLHNGGRFIPLSDNAKSAMYDMLCESIAGPDWRNRFKEDDSFVPKFLKKGNPKEEEPEIPVKKLKKVKIKKRIDRG